MSCPFNREKRTNEREEDGTGLAWIEAVGSGQNGVMCLCRPPLLVVCAGFGCLCGPLVAVLGTDHVLGAPVRLQGLHGGGVLRQLGLASHQGTLFTLVSEGLGIKTA